MILERWPWRWNQGLYEDPWSTNEDLSIKAYSFLRSVRNEGHKSLDLEKNMNKTGILGNDYPKPNVSSWHYIDLGHKTLQGRHKTLK